MAYKPVNEDFAIVFEERQIQEIEVGLAINMTSLNKNAQGTAYTANYFNTTKNKCKVTLQDPYLDGVAWGALGEMDKILLSSSRQANKVGDILPMCQEGQNPEKDKCLRYAVLDSKSFQTAGGSSPQGPRPWIIITLWYTLGGSSNQTIEQTYFFRATQVNITHGASGEPTVSLQGQAAINISFQQNLTPIFFEKNKTLIDEFNEKTDIKKEGFSIEDICSTPAEQTKFDRNYRVNSLTTQELLEKMVGAEEGGEILSLPTREFANKIEICTKQDNKCTFQRVFYLGKGLYEKYSINSKFELSKRDANLQGGSVDEKSDVDGVSTLEINKEYDSYRGDPATTSQKLRAVNSEAWQSDGTQFTELEDYNTGESTNGYRGTGTPSTGQPPNIKAGTFKIEKIENQMLFKVANSGSCYLGGKVKEEGDGRVLVESEYHIHYCEKGTSKCGTSMVMQEFKNLESIDYGDSKQLTPGASVGQVSSDPDSPSKTRFIIKIGKDSNVKEITLDPTTLQGLISCTLPLTDQERKEEAPTSGSEDRIGDKLGEVGSSGKSTGPHVDASWVPPRPITKADVMKYLQFGENGEVDPEMRSAYGFRDDPVTGVPNSKHNGVDLATDSGVPLFVKGGASIIDADRGVLDKFGYGYNVEIQTPEGVMRISHLLEGSIPADIPDAGGSNGSVRRAGNTGQASTSGKAQGITEDGIQLITEFKGVPKALYILPGRTILAFVTNYDEWMRSGKSNTIEPNVWIPEKYRNWVIVGTTHKWTNGDLRVKIEGRRPFRRPVALQLDETPRFTSYMADKGYKDYYDYIRSSGDLCYKLPDGEDSCSKCDRGLIGPSSNSSGSETQGSDASTNDISTSYPPGKFTYTCSNYNKGNVQAIANAANSLGITNKFAIAGIIGNALQESTVNPTALGDNGNALGIFQWNGPRKRALEAHAAEIGGDPRSINTQMSWFVREVKSTGEYSGLVSDLNNSTSVNNATQIFEDTYEKAGDPQMQNRFSFAQEIFNCLE